MARRGRDAVLLPSVRAALGRLSALRVFLWKSILCGGFVWARRALKHRKRRFPARAVDRVQVPQTFRHFLCLITPLCSYLYGGLYGGLYERAHIIRYFPLISVLCAGAAEPRGGRLRTLLPLRLRADVAGLEFLREHPDLLNAPSIERPSRTECTNNDRCMFLATPNAIAFVSIVAKVLRQLVRTCFHVASHLLY
jgi:hypothetical protein